jgi:hypothetical protein
MARFSVFYDPWNIMYETRHYCRECKLPERYEVPNSSSALVWKNTFPNGDMECPPDECYGCGKKFDGNIIATTVVITYEPKTNNYSEYVRDCGRLEDWITY